MNKVLALFFAIILLFSTVPKSSFAQYKDDNTLIENTEEILKSEELNHDKLSADSRTVEIKSGTCGDYITWSFQNYNTLIISGRGVMYDYTNGTTPWYDIKSKIKYIYIGDGITSIGDYAFCECDGMITAKITEDVNSIGNYSFYGCSSMVSIDIPDKVISIGSYAFSDCSSLLFVRIPDSIVLVSKYMFREPL